MSGIEDKEPISLLGRIEVTAMMVVGIVIVGMLTGEIVAILVKKAQRVGKVDRPNPWEHRDQEAPPPAHPEDDFDGHVTNTVRKGMLDMNLLEGRPELLLYGMLAALASAGTLLLVATRYGLPVSTTHSIVGGVLGWSPERVTAEVDVYLARVAAERASQDEPTDQAADAARLVAPDTRRVGVGRALDD